MKKFIKVIVSLMLFGLAIYWGPIGIGLGLIIWGIWYGNYATEDKRDSDILSEQESRE